MEAIPGDFSAAAIGIRVRDKRRERKLTQGELATRAGVLRLTVAYVESGREIKLQSFEAIVRALGASANYLLFGSRTE